MTLPTVFIVDDDPAIRDSASLLLEIAGLSAECHASAESFLDAYRADRVGCLVLDVRMGKMSGPELQAELVRRGSRLPIIFLTAHGDIPMTVRAMKAGAVDFLTKPIDGARLLERVQAALAQNEQELARLDALNKRRERMVDLTPREQEIMLMTVAGESCKAIAKALGISHRTVELHRSHLLQKTGAGSVVELAQLVADCQQLADRPAMVTAEEQADDLQR